MPIQKYKTTKGELRYRAHKMVDGQRANKSFDNARDARLWLIDIEEVLKGGGSATTMELPGDMLFNEAVDRFIVEARSTVSHGQIKNYEWAQKQLVKSFGDRAKMATITPQDVSAHVLRRMTEDQVGPSIIRLELSLIRLVYTKAVEWGINIPSPDLTIKRPKHKQKGREEGLDMIIKPSELVAILAEAKNRKSNLYEYLLFLLYTGMRPTEAASLYWQRLPVAEEKEAIKAGLPVGYVDLQRGGFSKVGTKTETRFVPAHEVTKSILEKLDPSEGKRLVFMPDEYIGKDRAYLYYRRPLNTSLKNARLANGTPLRGDINFYSFRHTARSAMENCGIPTAVAETIIGHQDRSFKFTYIHLSDTDLVREISRLNYPDLIKF